MYTSLLSLSLLLAPVVAADATSGWQTGYSAALEAGQKQKRPVAVFVGSGPKGQATLLKEGQFSAETQKMLADKYVCVYLDRSQPANQRLVSDLGITSAGLVISDRTGNFQAFHHNGNLSQTDLAQHLRRFGDPNLVVNNTVSNTSSRISYYNGGAQPATSFRTVNC